MQADYTISKEDRELLALVRLTEERAVDRKHLASSLSEASSGALPPSIGDSSALSGVRVSRIRAAVVQGKKYEVKLSRLESTYGCASSLDSERVRRVILASAAECALRAESARAQYWLIKTSATTTHGARSLTILQSDCNYCDAGRWVVQVGHASTAVRAVFCESTAMPSKNLCLS